MHLIRVWYCCYDNYVSILWQYASPALVVAHLVTSSIWRLARWFWQEMLRRSCPPKRPSMTLINDLHLSRALSMHNVGTSSCVTATVTWKIKGNVPVFKPLWRNNIRLTIFNSPRASYHYILKKDVPAQNICMTIFVLTNVCLFGFGHWIQHRRFVVASQVLVFMNVQDVKLQRSIPVVKHKTGLWDEISATQCLSCLCESNVCSSRNNVVIAR